MAQPTFTTKDFLTAAYCYTNGCRIVGTNRVGETVWVTFDDRSGRCGMLSEEVRRGEDFVSASLFHEASRRLKRLIYSA